MINPSFVYIWHLSIYLSIYLIQVANAEKLERERYLDQIHILSSQLGSANEKYNRVSIEAQTTKSEMGDLRAQVHDLTDKLEKAR